MLPSKLRPGAAATPWVSLLTGTNGRRPLLADAKWGVDSPMRTSRHFGHAGAFGLAQNRQSFVLTGEER
jgi:hypothetical protein